MSELLALLSDTTDRVLSGLSGADFASGWAEVARAGLPLVLVPEDKGGFGGSFEHAAIVVRATGHHATPLPLAEAVLAAKLVGDAELILPDEMLTLAASTKGRVRSGKFTGEMRNIAWGAEAGAIAGIVEDRSSTQIVVASRSDAEIVEQRVNPAGEPRSILQFEGANVQAAPLRGWSSARLYRMLALFRAGQIAGALDAALALSVQYATERRQFGKPLAGFQAIQQQLAVLAEETAAAGAAANAAFHAAVRGEASFEIAAAKLRANLAARRSTGIAHQVHGAMGFAAEYGLHRFTRRLWAWGSEFGNERYWSNEIGARVAARGPDAFWPDLVSPQA